jgi:hypothetical protein
MSKSAVIGALTALAVVAIVWNIGPARAIVFPATPRIGA